MNLDQEPRQELDPPDGTDSLRSGAPDASSFDFARFSGGWIIRIRASAMLEPFADELRAACRDFCRRAVDRSSPAANDGYEPDDVEHALRRAAWSEDAVGWIVVDERYRLVGFMAAELVSTLAAGRVEAQVSSYYLFPRRLNLRISGVLVPMLERWAESRGAQRIVFFSNRERPRAWGRLGYVPVARVYAKALGASNGG